MYFLPKLNYAYSALSPFMSEEQLKIHHAKHHNAYVDGANALLDNFEKSRSGGDFDVRAFAKAFAFQVNGFYMHNVFWENLAPNGQGGGGEASGNIGQAIDDNFGSFENFKKTFAQCALSVEGSGWAVLAQDKWSKQILPMQIEKHNANIYLNFNLLIALDMFEHAYYIDYKNDKAKYIEAFWHIINWGEVERRLLDV